MKNCPSCSKELPDAALHCVFCGAKQAPAPLAQGNARTVMGYSGPELELLRQAQAAPARPIDGLDDQATVLEPSMVAYAAAATGPASLRPAAGAPSRPGPTPYTPTDPTPSRPGPTPYNPPAGAVPLDAANAKTMFVAPSPVAPGAPGFVPPAQASTPPAPAFAPPAAAFAPPAPAYAPPAAALAPPAPQGGYTPPGHGYAPPGAQVGGYQPPPQQARAAPIPPYLASQTAARAGRPIEPWQDSLRMMMFIWGGLLLAAFATPLALEPMAFHWDVILEAPGKAKLAPLVLAATGLLSIVIGAIPLGAGARGAIAVVIGLSGVFAPAFVAGMPAWQNLVFMGGMLLLVASLLARNEYRDSTLPRILVTLAALAVLAPFLVPEHGDIPLVSAFKELVDAPGKMKIAVGLLLLPVVLAVASLLAWLPSPASGGARLLAWTLILLPLITHAVFLFVLGDPSMVENSPYRGAMQWVAGGAGGGKGFASAFGIGVAYLVITGYGLATLIGKKLE